MKDNTPTVVLLNRDTNKPIARFGPDAAQGLEMERLEGPYRLTWDFVVGTGGVTESGIRAWYKNQLMNPVSLWAGGQEVWAGYIHEMTLEMDGRSITKTMDGVVNAVKVNYNDDQGEPTLYTDWITNAESVIRYGRKEAYFTRDTDIEDDAIERATYEIYMNARPGSHPPTIKETEKSMLSVTAVGRIVLANNIQVIPVIRPEEDEGGDGSLVQGSDPYGDGTVWTVGDEILRTLNMISDIGGWLYAKDIATNTTQTVAGISTGNKGAYDHLMELTKLRGRTEEQDDKDDEKLYKYYIEVTNDGGVIYQQYVGTEPTYRVYKNPRGVELLDKSTPQWNAVPGIMRYIDDELEVAMPDTWLGKGLVYAERVTYRYNDPVASFENRAISSQDIWAAFESNLRLLETEE